MPNDTAGSLEKYERLFLRAKRKLFGVICVVQAEGDDRSRLKRGQPDNFCIGHMSAIREPQASASVRFSRMDGARKSDTSLLHVNEVSRRPTPSISMATICP